MKTWEVVVVVVVVPKSLVKKKMVSLSLKTMFFVTSSDWFLCCSINLWDISLAFIFKELVYLNLVY